LSANEDGSQDSQSKPAALIGPPESNKVSGPAKHGLFYELSKAIIEFFHGIQDSFVSIPYFFSRLGKYTLNLVFGLSRVAAVLFFMFYVVTCILRFWLWVVGTFLNLLRVLIRILTTPLRRMAGIRGHFKEGIASSALNTSMLSELRFELLVPFLRFVAYAGGILKTFWAIDVPRKIIAIILNISFVVGPALWVIPRSFFVEIIDPNALVPAESGKGYLILARDPHFPRIKFEFENENVLYLGKLNSPGLKAQFVTGKYYKIKVIGVRWYWPIPLYPNIISAEEVDANGEPIPAVEPIPLDKEVN